MTPLGGIFGAKTDLNQTIFSAENDWKWWGIQWHKRIDFFSAPFPNTAIHCHSTNSNRGITPGKENFNCHLCPIIWEVWGQDQVSQHQKPTRCGIPPGTGSFILELPIWKSTFWTGNVTISLGGVGVWREPPCHYVTCHYWPRVGRGQG